MVDLHCHILPGIDDGPPEMGDSVALARALAADGVRTVVATPHLRADHPRVVPEELRPRCDELNSRLAAEGVPLSVVSGGEVDLLCSQQVSRKRLALASFAGRGTDLLLETPYGPLPPNFEDLVLGLSRAGFRILLAHPERSGDFQRSPGRIAALVDDGVLVQVTASSLVDGPRRSPTRRPAGALLRDGLAHVLASDSHAAGGRAKLSEGVAAAHTIAPARSGWMITGAPEAVLAGNALRAADAAVP